MRQQWRPLMTNQKQNPSEIADHLIKVNGLEQAIQEAYNGTTKAQLEGDNYALSVWREVQAILLNANTEPTADT